jgi:hypothetical protein
MMAIPTMYVHVEKSGQRSRYGDIPEKFECNMSDPVVKR